MESVGHGARRRRHHRRRETPWGRWIALAVFALIAVAGPLAFGAVDRITQIGLLALLAIGVLAQPPAIARPGKWANALLLALLGIVLVKEFAPASWFGATDWRTTLTQSYALALPWTHNPEPSRAFDILLACAAAAVWLAWTRTLAAERANRPIMAWSLFAAAAIVAAVSFATHGTDPQAIYGMRFTPGWRGFGPFPNRNHSACFFAMGAIIGAGCITWAGVRKRYGLLALGAGLFTLVLAAMLATQSRGGVIAFGSGMAVLIAFILAKLRSRRALGLTVAASLVIAALVLAFGTKSLARFASRESAEFSNQKRILVWQDTLSMWQDAPLLGHGLGSFAQLFPLYQKVELDDEIVLHPESSWLMWLAELGALPVLIAALLLGALLVRQVREAFRAHDSFYLRVAGCAAVLGLFCHAAIDVPAHRWGTAGFALAALALACPIRPQTGTLPVSRKPAMLITGIAVFWSWPLLTGGPAWSPLALSRLVAREETTGSVKLAEIEESLRYFPLNPALHQAAGMQQLAVRRRTSDDWARHFQIAARLVPSSWRYSAEQARACRRLAPGHALHSWQMAIERGGHRREELLMLAMHETATVRGAATTWAAYAEAHPELLLAFARTAPEEVAREAYERWWKERGLGAEPPSESEVSAFHQFAAKFGTRDQLEQWMAARRDRRRRDFKTWAALLHQWGENARAWELLTSIIPEPSFPKRKPAATRERLEFQFTANPADLVNARAYAHQLDLLSEREKSREIIIAAANRPEAQTWFVEKAAYAIAERGELDKAVAMLLRAKR